MPSTFNILSAENELTVANDNSVRQSTTAVQSATGWGATNATLTVVDDEIHSINHYTFKVSPLTTATVTLSLNDVSVDGAINQDGILVFHALVKSSNDLSITSKIYQSADNPQPAGSITNNNIDSFTTCRSNYYNFPDDDTTRDFNIEMKIDSHQGDPFYITQFFLVNDNHFYKNPLVRLARQYIPDIYWTIDSQQTNPSFPMFKLLDAATWAAGDTSQLYSNFFDFENGELDAGNEFDVDPSWQESTLTSAIYHDPAFRSWLFQFTGGSFKKNAAFNGGDFFTTAQSIEDYTLWQIQNCYYGYNAGTLDAIKESVKQVLTGTKFVQVNYLSNWEFQIITYDTETPADLDGSDSSPCVLNAIAPAKAMGFQVSHLAIVAGSNTLVLNSSPYGQLDDDVLG